MDTLIGMSTSKKRRTPKLSGRPKEIKVGLLGGNHKKHPIQTPRI